MGIRCTPYQASVAEFGGWHRRVNSAESDDVATRKIPKRQDEEQPYAQIPSMTNRHEVRDEHNESPCAAKSAFDNQRLHWQMRSEGTWLSNVETGD